MKITAEYKAGDFCRESGCRIYDTFDKNYCKLKCNAYKFYRYIRDNGYRIVKTDEQRHDNDDS